LRILNKLGAQPLLGFFNPLWLVADGDQAQMYLAACLLGVVGYLLAPRRHLDWRMERTKFSDPGLARLGCLLCDASSWEPFRSLPSVVQPLELVGWKQDELSFRGWWLLCLSLFTMHRQPVACLAACCWVAWCWHMIPRRPRKMIEWNQGCASQMGMLAL
jgi:hypothetical protein